MIESIDEFEKQLRQGRGGVILYTLTHIPLPENYREALLNACLNDLRYDHQCEHSRGEYVFELIQIAGNSDYYRGQILTKLKTMDASEETKYDLLQLMHLTRLFAQSGDLEARNAL